MAIGHKLVFCTCVFKFSLSTFSNYTQLSTIIMVYWELSGKPHLVQPQCDLRVSGNKLWVGDGILELPGQQNWKPCGMAGKGGLLTGKESRQQQYMACLLPELSTWRDDSQNQDLRGTSNFRAERGSKGYPKSYHNAFNPCKWVQERWMGRWLNRRGL